MSDPRDDILRGLVEGIPYLRFLGIRFDRAGDELTAVLPYAPMLIGNPMIPALHGGVTSAFLELTAIVGLVWSGLAEGAALNALPKTIDLTVDYLRAGQARDAFARARINRSGRRYASVHVEAWQDSPDRLFAQGTGHFLMPASPGVAAD
jgi:uncharacterized protein (TIGR00369 family)